MRQWIGYCRPFSVRVPYPELGALVLVSSANVVASDNAQSNSVAPNLNVFRQVGCVFITFGFSDLFPFHASPFMLLHADGDNIPLSSWPSVEK